MGVREDGITLVNDSGGGGVAVDATIVAPLPLSVDVVSPKGQEASADSIPVVIASDQSPVPIQTLLPLDVTIIGPDPLPVELSGPVNQGEPNADVADAWPIKVTDGTDTASVGGSNQFNVDAKALVVAGYDAIQGRIHPIPVFDSVITPPTNNSRAVITELRSTTVANQTLESSVGKANLVVTGGTDNAASPSYQRHVFGDGNTLFDNPFNTYGLQVRQLGQSFATSGIIEIVGQRFTISSRYVVKTAAIFVLTNTGFLGTIRPVVSIDNGVNWAFTNAFNIETGAFASSFIDAAANGAYAIPFGAGATDYGFEVTVRTAGHIACRVSANSQGLSSLFAAATIIGAVDVSDSEVSLTELPAPAALADNTPNPTISQIATFPHVFDGSTWDMARGNALNGLLVNLGTNNDVKPTALVVEPEESEDYTLGDSEALTQTIQGFLRILSGALVSDVPKSYIEGDVKPLSINAEGRLRVATVDALRLSREDFMPVNINFTGGMYSYTGGLYGS